MKYFLAKTEPGVYSIADLERDHRTTWDGVKNPQALKAIRSMTKGDRVFVYHSGGESAVAGLAEVASAPRADPKDARLTVVDLAFLGSITPAVPLSEIKASGLFPDWALVRQPRLSTMEAPDAFVQWMRTRASGLKL